MQHQAGLTQEERSRKAQDQMVADAKEWYEQRGIEKTETEIRDELKAIWKRVEAKRDRGEIV